LLAFFKRAVDIYCAPLYYHTNANPSTLRFKTEKYFPRNFYQPFKTEVGTLFSDVYYGPGDVRLEELKINCRPTDIVVKILACARCGTDRTIFYKGHPKVDPHAPIVLGHELVGEIVEVGKDVSRLKDGIGYKEGGKISREYLNFQIGERVTVQSRIARYCNGLMLLENPIMGRMYRCEEDIKGEVFQPVAENFNWAVIAEPWYGIPVRKSLMNQDREGAFYELTRERELLRLAHKMINDEIISALLSYYGDILHEDDVKNYAIDLLRRILCPVFRDSIKRGIRGSLEKLEPGERFISGVRFIASAGFVPEVYCMIIAAAIKINKNEGRLKGPVQKILLDYCQLNMHRDEKIIELVERSCNTMRLRNFSY